VTPQTLDRILTCYRIGDPDGAYPIFDATGSTLYPGRWNTPTSPMIYASRYFSTALLEKLVRGSGRLPPNQHYIEIVVPPGVCYEMLDPAKLPGWDRATCVESKRYGRVWQRSRRSAILIVPSVVARIDTNILINPKHADFARIESGLHRPVFWDRRLFANEGAG
jgi:RES domain-containing protein